MSFFNSILAYMKSLGKSFVDSFDFFVHVISGGFAILYWIFWLSIFIFFLLMVWLTILLVVVNINITFNRILRMVDLDWRDGKHIESPGVVCDNMRRSIQRINVNTISKEEVAAVEFLLHEMLGAMLYVDEHNIYTPKNLQDLAAYVKKSNNADSFNLAYFRGRCYYVQSMVYNYPELISRYGVNRVWLRDILLALTYIETLKAQLAKKHQTSDINLKNDFVSFEARVAAKDLQIEELVHQLMRFQNTIALRDLEIENLKGEMEILQESMQASNSELNENNSVDNGKEK